MGVPSNKGTLDRWDDILFRYWRASGRLRKSSTKEQELVGGGHSTRISPTFSTTTTPHSTDPVVPNNTLISGTSVHEGEERDPTPVGCSCSVPNSVSWSRSSTSYCCARMT